MYPKVEIGLLTHPNPSTHLLKLRNASRSSNLDSQLLLPSKPPATPFIRQILLSKISFNISRGHFSFVYEMLKSKLRNDCKSNKIIDVKEINPNELVSDTNVWLQLETSQQNRKFLNGKTPLILCSYIKVF